MDIQIASNFERLIFDLNNEDDHETSSVMQKIKSEKKYDLDQSKLDKIRKDFLSSSADEKKVISLIKKVYESHKEILDPHTAIGYGGFDDVELEGTNIVLSTAHPCKFPDAIFNAINIKPDLPDELKYISDEKENFDLLDNDIDIVKQHIKEKIQ